ncbi:MAG: NTP transferase domain-containing protein [Bacteroidales bacterium]|nr:NTP transferase domain-containing protein [Bacteroidales bacterium]
MDHPAVIILAAGNSERMGKPKHLLPFSEGENFLEHIIRVYQRFVVSDMVIVINDSAKIQDYQFDEFVKIIVNKNLEPGRFFSVQLGLKELNNTSVFIQNIDNPFVNAGLLIKLMEGLNDEDYAVPLYEGRGGHPVLLSQALIEPLINDFNHNSHFNKVLKSFKRKDVIVNDPYIGVNINTPEDYLKYFGGLWNADDTD